MSFAIFVVIIPNLKGVYQIAYLVYNNFLKGNLWRRDIFYEYSAADFKG